jgi:hypothetical protein
MRRLILMLASLSACTEDLRQPVAGERCGDKDAACADGLVCVDGLCRVRPETPAPPTPPTPPVATFDIVAAPDLPAPTDTRQDDVPFETDTGPIVERLRLGAFDATAPADTRLALAIGQAAAAEIFVPINSRPELLRVTAWRPDTASCGLFRPLLWAPRALLPDGSATFGVFPDVIGLALPVEVRADTPTTIELPFPAELAPADGLGRAPYRVGARFEGPCTTSASTPFVLLDTSGDVADTFVWSEAWVPGADLGLPGRFALELQVVLTP